MAIVKYRVYSALFFLRSIGYKFKKQYPPLAITAMTFDLQTYLPRLYKRELLSETIIKELCAKGKEVLVNESNVAHVASPVVVVGDIHGT